MPSALVVQLAIRRRELRLQRLARGHRQKRLPNVHPPKATALAYAYFLQDLLQEARERLDHYLLPVLKELSPSRQDAARADAKLPPRAKAAIDKAAQETAQGLSVPRLAPAIQQVGGNVNRAQRKDILHQLSTGLGFNPILAEPDLGPAMAKFTSENVSLIRTLPGQYFADIEETVAAGLDAGDTWQDIADDMVDRLGVADSRARLIARDQVGKFYGRLNEERQTANGIDSYYWRTSEDNRVRDTHVERDGELFDWDDPPGDLEDPGDGGHPGQPINCRCHADPNLRALLDSL